MEKYIIYLLCIFLIYSIWKCFHITEGFSDKVKPDAITIDGVDDQNAIAILSKIAQDIQSEGGLKIMGNQLTKGKFTVPGAKNNQFVKDAGDGMTHFNHENGENYIRGNTHIHGSFNLLPTGVIVAWNGSTAPYGWAVCDGQNGTPDLRGRFIRAASPTQNIDISMKVNQPELNGRSRVNPKTAILKHDFGNYGGTDFTEMILNEMPAHNHIGDGLGTTKLMSASTYRRGMDKGDYASYDSSNSGPHNIADVLVSRGLGWGQNNQPPYYVLTYIMKL
jgi:microcystin-dependent protein